MVSKGQYLERPAVIPCGPLALEGLYHRGDRPPAILVCPPLGAAGMDAPPVAELAWACARVGHPSLRFQHRGFGASEGGRDPAKALEDAEAALAHLHASAPGPIAIAGFGSGCATALALSRAHPEVRALVLVAPDAAVRADGIAGRLLVLRPGAGREVEVGPGIGVEVVDGADERFLVGLPEVGRAAIGFLAG